MVASLLFLAPLMLGPGALGAPSIEADEQNINVAVRNGVFQVNGATVAVASDVADVDARVTAAVEAVRTGLTDLTDRVAGLERSLAGNVTDSAASIDAVSAALDTFSASQTDALGEIGETLAGLEAGVAGAVGWMGSYNASAACTTASCSIIIYGRGFVSLPDAPAALAGMYTVTVAIDEAGSSATMPCAVDEVQSNWIRCTITEFQGPPSRSFWLSATVSENGRPFPYSGPDTPPVRVAQMAAMGPTVSFGGTAFLSFNSDSGAQLTHTQAISVADYNHPNSALTVTFTSSDTGVLPVNGLSYASDTITLVFQQIGTTEVRVTVTDDLGLSASITIVVTLVEDVFECSNPAPYTPSGHSCMQTPVDPHWGRGSQDCSVLFDGDMTTWSPGSARHVTMPDGEFMMEFSAMTVYSVNVIQFSQHAHGHFKLFAKDLNSNSASYGELVQFFESGSVEYSSSGRTLPGDVDAENERTCTSSAVLPVSLRRTDTIKFVADVPSSIALNNRFVWIYRIMEVQLIGCE